MSTITRKQFISELSNSKSGINVNDLSPETRAKLAEKGVSEQDLKKIAGSDGRISGEAEYKKLFKLVDRFDENGSSGSIDTSDKAGAPTPSGEVYESLKAEVERNALRARNQGVIHLGMRDTSTKEAAALEKANPAARGGVVRIEAYKSNGVIEYGGKKHDLGTAGGRASFRDALVAGPDKMSKAQAKDFVSYLGKQTGASRDELAQLGLALLRAGEGKLPVSRLVLSGHGTPGGSVQGDDDGEFTLNDVKDLAAVFPKGAEKIEHVAVSACFCAGARNFETLREAFPNLKSAFAYNEFSPKAEKGAPADLTTWERMTEGDPSQVDPKIKKTATWNIADGTQGLPNRTLGATERAAKDMEFAYDAYRTGKKDLKDATHDPQLNEYYVRLADLERHPDISPERKEEVVTRRKEVLAMRHPELHQ
jgi:hypothetical protein